MLRQSVLVALLLAIASPLAFASRAIVPEDFPSVQEAIDSGADTVQIKPGVYAEVPVVDSPLVIEGVGVGGRPRLDGLVILHRNFFGSTRLLAVINCEFSGRVEMVTDSPHPRLLEIEFFESKLDSGFHQVESWHPRDIANLVFSRCLLGGNSSARAAAVHMEQDTVHGGVAWDIAEELAVQQCWFRGVDGTALDVRGSDVTGLIADNQIEGYAVGINANNLDDGRVERNTVLGAAECGIRVRSSYTVSVANNVVENCGVGIDASAQRLTASDNTILRAAGFGLSLDTPQDPSTAVRNVVGHCGGTGILVLTPLSEVQLTNNTLFNNAGNGIEVYSSFGGGLVATRNIGAFNKGFGLRAHSGAVVEELGCNDWFGNGLGPVEGAAPDPTDLSADPLFCDADEGDVTLRADSPVLDASGCGLVGALRAGCGAPGTITVIVPDEIATIQEAIDAGAETVLIRDGVYDEFPATTRSVMLSGIGPGRPRLRGLAFFNHGDPREAPQIFVNRIMFSGPIELTTNSVRPRGTEISFVSCALDSGVHHLSSTDPFDIASLSISRSTMGGYSRARMSNVFMEADTIDGGVSWNAEGVATVRQCWFRGGVGSALEIEGDAVSGRIAISDNTIEGYATGIATLDDDVTVIESNVLRGCGTGIQSRSSDEITARNNTVRDCGVGIDAQADLMVIAGNIVLSATECGVRLDSPDRNSLVSGNVIGNSGGPGLFVRRQFGPLRLEHNTVFRSERSGIEVVSRFEGTLTARNNISYGNQEWGLVIDGSLPVTLECNDWFANSAGHVTGVPMGPTDLAVDPQFCDVDGDDVSLVEGSPLLAAPGCGQIGALGFGCGATPVLVALLRADPTNEGIRIEWQWGGLERPSEFWFERADEKSGPWVRIQTERHVDGITTDWDRDVEAGRTYFYRLAWTIEEGEREVSETISGTMPGVAEFALKSISPNPSRGRVEIAWSLPQAGHVDLAVFDITGREMAKLASGRAPAGSHASTWSGSAPPGLYLVRLRHNEREAVLRVFLRR